MRNIVKTIAVTLMIAGFVVVLGTAGASDADAISFGQILGQSALGLMLGAVGFGGLYYTERGQR